MFATLQLDAFACDARNIDNHFAAPRASDWLQGVLRANPRTCDWHTYKEWHENGAARVLLFIHYERLRGGVFIRPLAPATAAAASRRANTRATASSTTTALDLGGVPAPAPRCRVGFKGGGSTGATPSVDTTAVVPVRADLGGVPER
jgi:hypothetical protein